MPESIFNLLSEATPAYGFWILSIKEKLPF